MNTTRSIYLVILYISASVLTHCTSIPPTTSQDEEAPQAISSSDSDFERFENLAETAPEKYVTNPDSFLNSFHLHPQTIEQKETYTYGLIFMAYALKEHGDIYQSTRYYERVLGFVQQHDMKDPAYLDYIIKPLANNYIRIDDNQKAISLLEKTINEISDDDYEHLSGFTGNLANAYLFNGEPHKAEELLLKTLKYPIPSLSRGLLYNTLSDILKDDHGRSNRYNQLALDEFNKHNLTGDTLVWYTSALGLYAELNNHVQSAQKASSILNQNFPTSQFRTKAKLQQTIANLLYTKDDFQTAKQHFGQVISLFTQALDQKYVLDYTYTQALVGLARCHSKQNQPDSALHYFQWAIENDFRTQQLITSKRNQINNNIWNREIIEEMSILVDQQLQHRIGDNQLIETLLWCIELSKGRLLINEINRSENWDNASPEIKEAIQDIRNLHQRVNQSDQESERQQLQKQIQQTIMDFQLSERYFETFKYAPEKNSYFTQLNDNSKDYFSYFIHQDQTISLLGRVDQRYIYQKITDSLFIPKLRQFKESYFGDSPNNYNLDPQQYREQALYFAQQLLPDIQSARADIHLSLDGSLYGLPFDALYNDGFLVKKHNFAYLNSFILYDLLKTDRTEKTDIALLYRSQFPEPLPDLNFVHEEVANIGKAFHSHRIAPQQQHDSTIVQLFASSHIIHIASHTILDPEENPIIYLQQPISTEQLRFYHIYSPMIFLSACNTGSGKSLPSEGMESIQRVFLGKGVPSVISTYWFANDEAMLRLTTLFYQELNKSHKPVQALANAKRLFLQKASVEQQNPWYWSNINYAGVDNEIGLRKISNLSTILLFGILLIIGSVVLFRYLRPNTSIIEKNKEPRDKFH